MRNYVIINGTNSNTINGLGINELPPISKPPLRVQTEEIDGRDGDIITPLGYGAYNKTITIGLFGTGYNIDNIVSFFNGEGTIVFSNEPDKYYNYKIIEQIDYEALQKFKQASITFHCQPFKYPLSETPKEIEPNIKTLSNVEIANITDSGISTIGIDLKGNTSQSGTPTPTSPVAVNVVSGDNDIYIDGGKNKLPFRNQDFTLNNVRYYVENGSLKLNGTSSGETSRTDNNFKENFSLYLEAGTYNFSKKSVSGNDNYFGAYINKYSDNTQLAIINSTGTNTTFTLNATTQVYLGFYVYQKSFNNDNLEIMLSTTGGDYEPYTSQTYEVDLPVENIVNAMQESFTLPASATTYQKIISTSDTDNKVHLVANTKYYISYTIENASTSNTRSTPRLYLDSSNKYENTSTNRNITAGRKVDEYTPTTTGDYAFQYWLQGSDVAVVISDIMISTNPSKAYTPYGTTPIELCKIGTYQDYFTKNSGKNKFNGTMYNGQIGSNGGFSASTNRITNAEQEISNTLYLEKGTYTLSINGLDYCTALTKDSNNTILQNFANSWNALPFTFTLTQDGYLYFTARRNDNANITPSDYKVMINEGSTAQPYEPYGTGQWCKYNAIGKVVLDGSETWTSGTTSVSGHYRYYYQGSNILSPSTTGETPLIYCSHYKGQIMGTAGSWGGHQGIALDVGNNKIVINDDTYYLQDVSSYKTWLSTNNVSVYYVFQTPYLSLIEDNNLIEQLDNLENAMSYEGTTNIGQVNNDKAFLMDVDYLEQGTDEITINNIGNTYAKPTIALEGNGVGNIYLNDTQIFRVELTDKMTISTSSMEAYDPDTSALLNRQVVGNYNSMTLQPGNNTIRIDGIDKATITDYTRWL